MSFWLALLFLGIAALALASRSNVDLLHGLSPTGEPAWGLDAQELAILAAGVSIALLVLPALFGAYRGRAGKAFRDLLGWAVIAAGGFGIYNYRNELGQIAFRIAGELQPPGVTQTIEPGPTGVRAERIKRRKDGHFTAKVSVNGASVEMLVDTGASTVVLRQPDAKKLGVETSLLKYTVPVQTANGVAYAAHIRLRNVSIGTISLGGVDALVAQPGVLKESLLGMTFLSRLRSYEFSGQYLTFRN